jgi:hypothetical protein
MEAWFRISKNIKLDFGFFDNILGFPKNIITEKGKKVVSSSILKFHPFGSMTDYCNLAEGVRLKHGGYNHRETDITASLKPGFGFRKTIIFVPSLPLFFPQKTRNLKGLRIR